MSPSDSERAIIAYIIPDVIQDVNSYKGDVRTLIGTDITSFYRTFEAANLAANFFEITQDEIIRVANSWQNIGIKIRDEVKTMIDAHNLVVTDGVKRNYSSRIYLPITALDNTETLYLECSLDGYFDCSIKKRIIFMYKEPDKDLPVYYLYLNDKAHNLELNTEHHINTADNVDIPRAEKVTSFNREEEKYSLIAKIISKMSEEDIKTLSSMMQLKDRYEDKINNVPKDSKANSMLNSRIQHIEQSIIDYITTILE